MKLYKILFILFWGLILQETVFAQISTTFKYSNESLDNLDAIKYRDYKITTKEFIEKYRVEGFRIDADTILINSIILYKTIGGDYQIFSYSNIFLGKRQPANKIYTLANHLLPETSVPINIKTICSIDVQALIQFYSSNDDPAYEEINKLKSLVKDKNGVLDAYKLAQILNKNSAVLSKYSDK